MRNNVQKQYKNVLAVINTGAKNQHAHIQLLADSKGWNHGTHEGVNYKLLEIPEKNCFDPEERIAEAVCALKEIGELQVDLRHIASPINLKILKAFITDGLNKGFCAKTKDKECSPFDVQILATDDCNAADKQASELRHGDALGLVRAFVRTLVDMSSDRLMPSTVIYEINKFIQKHETAFPELRRLMITSKDASDEAVKKMGSFLAVGRGSSNTPRFIEITLNVKDHEEQADVNFVGKGVTFDSGGISIKPSSNMHMMKGDMAGAATSIGAILYAAMVHGEKAKMRSFTPFCENMPGQNAMKPGDILTAYNSKTIEVIDTDAEGRLILADALSYASEFKATHMVEMSTLTGAARGALGYVHAPLFTESETLQDLLVEAGKIARDKVWPMPMGAEYADLNKSKFADVANLAAPGSPGSINGAVFLKEFVPEGLSWAHIDIANVAGLYTQANARPLNMIAQFIDTVVAERAD